MLFTSVRSHAASPTFNFLIQNFYLQAETTLADESSIWTSNRCCCSLSRILIQQRPEYPLHKGLAYPPSQWFFGKLLGLFDELGGESLAQVNRFALDVFGEP
jgi:hypothetical protein